MSSQELTWAAMSYVCLLLSLSFHEAAHSVTADKCGDPTGRLMGRSSLNPMAHIDPIGTVILPLVMIFSGIPYLFGWAKPVPFNPRNLHNIRRDPALIGLAGPLSNLALVLLCAALLRIIVGVLHIQLPADGNIGTTMRQYPLFGLAFMMVIVNTALMLFNLIPIPPLDGGHLLHGLLPSRGQEMLDRIGPFGILIAVMISKPLLSYPFVFLQALVLYLAFVGQS
ncbi:MAG: site-2 protease family protein [Candidatus Hydrogenedentes bacterium]|nr:site-2 protease family protein [Candidatus Hydrogenedentota bacterium]